MAKGLAVATATSLPERDEMVRRVPGPRNPYVEVIAKATVEAITLQDPVAAGPLTSLQQLSSAYIAREATRSILGTPGFRRVPMNTLVAAVESGTSATWAGTGQPTRVSSMAFTRVTLGTTSLSVISVLTDELAKFSSPEALTIVESDLLTATARAIDAEMLSSTAAVDGLKPAGLLAGKSPIGGGSPSSAESDVYTLITSVRSGEAAAPVFFLSRYGAAALAQLRSSGGDRLFPDLGLNGGDILGVPAVITRAAESKLILADAATILVGDAGVDIDRAEAAALQMSDAPAAGAASMVSLFQTNSIALRVRRWICWQPAFDDSVAYIDIVGAGSPA